MLKPHFTLILQSNNHSEEYGLYIDISHMVNCEITRLHRMSRVNEN